MEPSAEQKQFLLDLANSGEACIAVRVQEDGINVMTSLDSPVHLVALARVLLQTFIDACDEDHAVFVTLLDFYVAAHKAVDVLPRMTDPAEEPQQG